MSPANTGGIDYSNQRLPGGCQMAQASVTEALPDLASHPIRLSF